MSRAAPQPRAAARLHARRSPRSLRSHRRLPHGAARWAVLAAVCLCALLVVAPFLLLLLNSVKTEGGYSRGGPLAWPRSFTLEPWRKYVHDVDYTLVLGNSVAISVLVAVFGVAVSLLAAYALGIGRIRGNAVVTGVLLFATMLPQESLLYPLYYGAQELGLRNTIWSVVIIFTVLQGAFGTYLLASLMATFPQEILEAAAIDGVGRWKALWRIVLPMMRPSVAVLLVFFFVWTWNEFYIPFVMLTDPSVQTVPIALSTLQGQNTLDVTELNAGSLLSLLPTLVFFLLFQRTLTRGVAVGAVK
jgi:raffinose/stachyose/melibiose transport system permease protein